MKIIILSEDRNKDSGEVITNIIKKALGGIDPKVNAILHTLSFDTSWNREDVLKGTYWKSSVTKKKEPWNSQMRELMMRIINALLDEECYVFWHIDGDVTWKSFCKKRPYNHDLFHKVLKENNTIMAQTGKMFSLDTSKLFLVMPCYSIEAWLYPFVETIGEVHNHNQRRVLDELATIEVEEFDEIEKIKDTYDITDTFNAELSQQFCHDTLYKIGKSYTALFKEMNENEGLQKSLQERLSDWDQQ